MEYTEIIINLDTDERITRPYSDEEIAAAKAIQAQFDAEDNAARAEAEAKAIARQVILDRLGLTAEEANLLLG